MLLKEQSTREKLFANVEALQEQALAINAIGKQHDACESMKEVRGPS